MLTADIALQGELHLRLTSRYGIRIGTQLEPEEITAIYRSLAEPPEGISRRGRIEAGEQAFLLIAGLRATLQRTARTENRIVRKTLRAIRRTGTTSDVTGPYRSSLIRLGERWLDEGRAL